MTRYGFHASHEQIPPSQLLADVQHAERAGFQMAMCSDHLEPWSARQGHSGYAWSWLGAALATTNLSFGAVCAPGYRYHPAIVAQKIATLGEMFPGRFWVALGSGEAANEHVTGERWPAKPDRDKRLDESVAVIRRLLDGEEVTHHGLVTVDRARVWERADPTPKLIAPVATPGSATRVAAWADGLVTFNQGHDQVRAIVDAYREAGGRGPLSLQVHLSWAPTLEEAEHLAHDQWRTNVFTEPVNWDTESAGAFDVMAEHVGLESTRKSVQISADLDEHVDLLRGYADLGFDDLYLHHVGQQQESFIDTFGEHVLPRLSDGS